MLQTHRLIIHVVYVAVDASCKFTSPERTEEIWEKCLFHERSIRHKFFRFSFVSCCSTRCVFFLHEKAIKTAQINLSPVFHFNLYPILFTLHIIVRCLGAYNVSDCCSNKAKKCNDLSWFFPVYCNWRLNVVSRRLRTFHESQKWIRRLHKHKQADTRL